jgi:hypothetical protein
VELGAGGGEVDDRGIFFGRFGPGGRQLTDSWARNALPAVGPANRVWGLRRIGKRG